MRGRTGFSLIEFMVVIAGRFPSPAEIGVGAESDLNNAQVNWYAVWTGLNNGPPTDELLKFGDNLANFSYATWSVNRCNDFATISVQAVEDAGNAAESTAVSFFLYDASNAGYFDSFCYSELGTAFSGCISDPVERDAKTAELTEFVNYQLCN